MGRSNIGLTKQTVSRRILIKIIILVAGFSVCSVDSQGQELKEVEIHFCKNNDSEFEQELIRNLGYNLVAIQQDYLPVDSFGITWSAENRVRPVPLTWGIATDSSVIVFEPTLTPWEIDTFFQLNKEEYFWEKGQLTSAKFLTMPRLNTNDVAFYQDTVDVDTIAPGVFAYRNVNIPQDIEIAAPEPFNRSLLKGYILYFALENHGYEFCLLPWTYNESEGSTVNLTNKVKGGFFLVPEAKTGQGRISIKLGGKLLPKKQGYSQFKITPYVTTEK
jgi:hypothetical protein